MTSNVIHPDRFKSAVDDFIRDLSDFEKMDPLAAEYLQTFKTLRGRERELTVSLNEAIEVVKRRLSDLDDEMGA